MNIKRSALDLIAVLRGSIALRNREIATLPPSFRIAHHTPEPGPATSTSATRRRPPKFRTSYQATAIHPGAHIAASDRTYTCDRDGAIRRTISNHTRDTRQLSRSEQRARAVCKSRIEARLDHTDKRRKHRAIMKGTASDNRR